MARLIYGEYESNKIAPVVAIDLERHLYSQYSFLYEIGGLINHIVAAHPTNKDTRSFDFIAKKIIALAALVDWKLKNSILILWYKIKRAILGRSLTS